MQYAKKLPKLALLSLFLLGALLLDLIFYALFSACPNCSSFAQFIQTPAALTGPILASISSLFALTKRGK